ncbi:DNA cytosine methyltransferase [Fibrobacter sp. UWT3]|uniref:DNA cytosine methyltransferase n=1 Tax=Fibrobacter sp. UWT3 TaxID=1896225 RepID=UPI00114267D4|nr:DNA cytosine methyltransferase [Fibrobacter sp. UWT3]
MTKKKSSKNTNVIKFIDLFAGIGGIRAGLESAIHECGFVSECVFTSEIKPHAISILGFVVFLIVGS